MKKLRLAGLLLNVVELIFLTACGLGSASPTPDFVMIQIATEESAATPVIDAASPPTPPSLIPAPENLLTPDWVRDFADPILVKLVNRKPDFQDDFSLVCIYNSQRMDRCPSEEEMPNFIDDLAVLNKGWFYMVPGSKKGPYYADVQDGALLLTSPSEKEDREGMVYNPYLLHKNFVLSFEFQFDHTEPDDLVRFQFSQSADQSVNLDLSKNTSWRFYNTGQAVSGVFEYFPPEPIRIMFILLDKKCAVYLNDIPAGYLDECRSAAVVGSFPWALSFHVIAAPDHVASAKIDNVKLWDLDKVPDLR